jgi:prephenate dehydratase
MVESFVVKFFSDSSPAVGYLGPPGTFTHQALQIDPDLAVLPHEPYPDVESLVTAVADGRVGRGLVAWDNSVAGPVGETQDLLARARGRVYVQRDVVLPVRMCLWGRRGAQPAEITEVVSHPHALGQCATWIRTALPGALTRPAPSTIAALRPVAGDGSGCTAAVAPASATAPDPDVVILARDIADEPRAETRFMVIGPSVIASGGSCRTLLACYSGGQEPATAPGEIALRPVFQAFSRDGIELLWLGVRPTRAALGGLCLLLECRGEPETDPSLRAALDELAACGVRTEVLGVLAGAAAGRPRPTDAAA